MPEKLVCRGTLGIVSIPVVGEDAGVRDHAGQHLGVVEPVDLPGRFALSVFPGDPRLGRLSTKSMKGDDTFHVGVMSAGSGLDYYESRK